jgi:hypothetical protein
MPRVKGAKNKPKAKAPKMSFNERVRKVIKGEAETKEKVVNVFNQSNINGCGLDTTTTPDMGLTQPNLLDVLNIQQGSEQEEREGNKINDCRLRLRGFIQSNEYSETNTSTYPYEVHMVFFKEKKQIANDNSQLKQLPNNQTVIVDGTVLNSLYPYNKDKYIIRKVRVFKMRPLNSGISSTSSALLNSQQSNDPAYRRFVETIDIHKELKFNDQSNVPANDWCGVSFFVINGDNTALPETQVRAKVSMDAVLRYKDL